MVTTLKNYFASNLKRLLKLKGANQKQLAEFIGVKQTSISNWINEVSSPDVDNLLKTHRYFGLKSLDDLVLQNLTTENTKWDTTSHHQHTYINELLAAKDKIIKLQDEKIERLENELNGAPAVTKKTHPEF